MRGKAILVQYIIDLDTKLTYLNVLVYIWFAVFGLSRNLVSALDTTPPFSAAMRTSGLRLRLRLSVTIVY